MERVCIKGKDVALTDSKNHITQRKTLKTRYKGRDWRHDLLWAESIQKSYGLTKEGYFYDTMRNPEVGRLKKK